MTPLSDTRSIKLSAKDIIKRRTMAILLMSALFVILQTLTETLANQTSGQAQYQSQVTDTMSDLMDSGVLDEYLTTQDSARQEELFEQIMASMPEYELPGTFALILTVVVSIATILLSVGYQYHTLLESRGVETNFRSLFYAFNRPLKALALQLVTSVLTALGTLLLIVPGVILSLRYSMALMVLFDHPSYGVFKCMRESARLTRGNKMRLFKLELSFLPWILLSTVVMTLTLLPVLDLWVYPYYFISRGIFYSQLTAGNWGEAGAQPFEE